MTMWAFHLTHPNVLYIWHIRLYTCTRPCCRHPGGGGGVSGVGVRLQTCIVLRNVVLTARSIQHAIFTSRGIQREIPQNIFNNHVTLLDQSEHKMKTKKNKILYYPFVRSHWAWPWYFSVSPAQQLCMPCEPHVRFMIPKNIFTTSIYSLMILPFGWFSTIHCFHARLA